MSALATTHGSTEPGRVLLLLREVPLQTERGPKEGSTIARRRLRA